MTEYIKLKDAIRAMAQYLMEIGQWKSNIATSVMSKVKAADVVEVVRCKDCKHYGKFGMKCNKLHLTPIESWRYCSFGERADT